ncbi:MAG: hypothetical protein ACTSVK_08350 [Promethearchaeota archaeon]
MLSNDGEVLYLLTFIILIMANIIKNLPIGSLDIDKFIKVNFFPTNERGRSRNSTPQECRHLGILVKDGHNISSSQMLQRITCSKCGARFGNNVNEWDLNRYQERLKLVLYELFFEGCKQTKMEKRWGIPQPKLSKFKHDFVKTVLEQYPDLLNSMPYDLPKGVIYGDETYLGKRGNSNTEILFTNDNFEVLSTGIGEKKHLEKSILKTFFKMPKEYRDKMRVLVSDGEPSYQTLTLLNSHKVVLVQQYHKASKLGQITIHKYQKFGPHILHYLIHTHWKLFKKEKHELGFKWEIKLIQGKLPIGRGRPTIQMTQSRIYKQWRQKKVEYNSNTFQKKGSAKVYINPDSKKISLRQGSKKWMQGMIQQIIIIFHGKFITNNRSESKNSQIKRTGNMRKQPNEEHSDHLFQLQEYIVKNGHLPQTFIKGRPLYKYLMKDIKSQKIGYRINLNKKEFNQTLIESYF